MILSSKIKFIDQNTNKMNQLELLHVEYVRALRFYIDLYWDYYNLDNYNYKKYALSKWSYYPSIPHKFDSILSARILKCVKTQAIGMIKSRTSKLNKLFYVLEKEQERKSPDKDKISSLQRTIQKKRDITKPYISSKTPMELNSIVFNKMSNKTKTKDFVYQLSSIWDSEYKKRITTLIRSIL